MNTIWEQLLSKLKPCEIEEAKYLLGRSRIEKSEDISAEIQSLLSLYSEIPSQFNDLSSHKNKVEFYLNKLAVKAKELGIETKDLINLKTSRDKYLFEFLTEGALTRPSTADSSQKSEFSSNIEKISQYKDMINFIEDFKLDLQRGIDSEYDFLKTRAEAIQQDLIGMTSVPTSKEVNDFTKKLEDAVINEVHPALFQMSGKNFFVIEEEKKEPELDFDLENPPQIVCKPKLREIKKPSRPNTASVKGQEERKESCGGNGKMARRLRSLVKDHKDLPM